jgi:predicted ATPase
MPLPGFLAVQTLGDLSMHLKRIVIFSDQYPNNEVYPFNQRIFQETKSLEFQSPVTLFVGENGTGKSTLLQAIALRCTIHIWQDRERKRVEYNPFEDKLYRFLGVEWIDGSVPGSFFSSELFRYFSRSLDEWAAADPATLEYFGGKSLVTQSHGQSLMSFFRSRYQIKGLYLLDEPETALSPKSQVAFVRLLQEMGDKGHAQFIVATHSPMILACPGANIYSFDKIPVERVNYEDTEHYRIYKSFMENPKGYF